MRMSRSWFQGSAKSSLAAGGARAKCYSSAPRRPAQQRCSHEGHGAGEGGDGGGGGGSAGGGGASDGGGGCQGSEEGKDRCAARMQCHPPPPLLPPTPAHARALSAVPCHSRIAETPPLRTRAPPPFPHNSCNASPPPPHIIWAGRC